MISVNLSNHSHSKSYFTTYKEFGYEFGIGERGSYPGHSHYYFIDVIFSPEGVHYFTADGQQHNSKIVVVAPRTYIGDVKVGNFAFIKFCPTKDSFTPPEKTLEILQEGSITNYDHDCSFELDWYKAPSKGISKIHFKMALNTLLITVGNQVYSIK